MALEPVYTVCIRKGGEIGDRTQDLTPQWVGANSSRILPGLGGSGQPASTGLSGLSNHN